eukprot:1137150-Pelagomonas_calceolata.AAC.9
MHGCLHLRACAAAHFVRRDAQLPSSAVPVQCMHGRSHSCAHAAAHFVRHDAQLTAIIFRACAVRAQVFTLIHTCALTRP